MVKARVSSVFCSSSCALAEPVAGLALALDAEGLLYVSDAANNRIYKLEAATGRQE